MVAVRMRLRPPDPAPKRWRRSGYDPYASDGGYGKLHSWERVDHD